MKIEMPEGVQIDGLVGALFADLERRLTTFSTVAELALSKEAPVLHVTPHGRIRRQWAERRVLLHQGCQVVVVELDGPPGVLSIEHGQGIGEPGRDRGVRTRVAV